MVEAALEQRSKDRRVDRFPVQASRRGQIADRNDTERQHVIIVEQTAIEPWDRCGPETTVAVRHGSEEVAQHRFKIVRALYRLIEDVGEDPIGQKLDIFGEEAEHELVDEMG